MKRGAVETIMGLVVIGVAVTFLVLAYRAVRVETAGGYRIEARFVDIGGLRAGADVRIGGIKVGAIAETRLEPETYEAVVVLSINDGVGLPVDTVAAIASEGILGGAYMRLRPGGAAASVAAGGAIEKTEDFRSLEDQVGEIIFLATGAAGASEP